MIEAISTPSFLQNEERIKDEIRKKMHMEIVKLLQARRPHATETWTMKLPDMATRLEDALYQKAKNVIDYSDKSTLKERLQDLARNMAQIKTTPIPSSVHVENISIASVDEREGGEEADMKKDISMSSSNENDISESMPLEMPKSIPESGAIKMPESLAIKMPESLAMEMPESLAMEMPKPIAMEMPDSLAMEMPESLAMEMPKPIAMEMPKPIAMEMPESLAMEMPESLAMEMPESLAMEMPKSLAIEMPKSLAIEMPKSLAMEMPESLAMEMPKSLAMEMPKSLAMEMPESLAMAMPESLKGSEVASSSTPLQMPETMIKMPDSIKLPPKVKSKSAVKQDPQSSSAMVMEMPESLKISEGLPSSEGLSMPESLKMPTEVGNTETALAMPVVKKEASPKPGIKPESNGNVQENQPTVEQRQHVLRQQQQRLLLLRHASKCPSEVGMCQATPHCAAMKTLWHHIAGCKEQQCKVSHCTSSRYVLNHYHRCKNVQCDVCGPVREAIQKNNGQSSTVRTSVAVTGAAVSSAPPQATYAPPNGTANHAAHAAQLKARQIQIYQSKAMTLSAQELMQQTNLLRQATQTAMKDVELSMQHLQEAVHQMNTATLENKEIKTAQAYKCKEQTMQYKQRAAGIQTQFQAYCMVARNMQQTSQVKAQQAQHAHQQASLAMQQQLQIQMQSQKSLQMSSQSKAAVVSTPMLMTTALSMPPELSNMSAELSQTTTSTSQSSSSSSTALPQTSSPKENPRKRPKIKQEKKVVKIEKVKSPPVPDKTGPVALAEGTSILPQLSNEQLESHLSSLRRTVTNTESPVSLKSIFSPVLKKLLDHEHGWVFKEPVNPTLLDIPDYFTIVTFPMDLGTIRKKLEANYYKQAEDFAYHVRLTFENAILYNEEHSEVYQLARDLLNTFNKEYSEIQAVIEKEELAFRERPDACRLCAASRFVFEPAVFYCNGPCGVRIRRNSYYFSSPCNKAHWCSTCYQDLSEEESFQAGDKTILKTQLAKKKNDEVNEESWVQCDHCNKWVHQICALFNGRSSAVEEDDEKKETSVPFHCPICLLELRRNEPKKFPIAEKTLSAIDLPTTKMSEYIEERVHAALAAKRASDAEARKCPIEEVPTAEGIVIRQLSNIERQLHVREKMFERYEDSHSFPAEFKFKSKFLGMFQTIDGIPTFIFGMYVHEFDEKEPEPNARRVYISYLDSVQFFAPKHLRTIVYHEILIAYLAFVKARGFHTAHIWACPPLKGDDYILYCHPEDQKTPKSERLRAWYLNMLAEAQKQGIVLEIQNMFAEYWRDDNYANVLPYFEGDYWVGVAEEFAKDIENEVKEGTSGKKGKKGKKRKIIKSNSGSKRRKVEGGSVGLSQVSDPMMIKFGTAIEPMKDDFLVVKLQPYCTLCRKSILAGTRYMDENTATSHGLNPEKVEYSLCENCYTTMKSKSKREQYPVGKEKVVALTAVQVTDVPAKCIDADEIMESEFFDTRQLFLSLCQTNHYQFDQLRRAKHTSLMTLYHLHNPAAPAYVYVCNHCQKDITSGHRWHCETCSDFDVCDNCHKNKKHEHPLAAIAVQKIAESKEDAAKNRKAQAERARSIQLHMQLLVHASGCNGTTCPSANCAKMKALLKHGASCQVRAAGGCPICRRVWALLQVHARQCRTPKCAVPRCKDLKEHMRRLQRQQEQMDDRRRHAFTDAYQQQSSSSSSSVPASSSSSDVRPSLPPPSVEPVTPSPTSRLGKGSKKQKRKQDKSFLAGASSKKKKKE